MLTKQAIVNLERITHSEMAIISISELINETTKAAENKSLNRFCNFTRQRDVKDDLKDLQFLTDSYGALIKYHNNVLLVPLHRDDSDKIQMATILRALKNEKGIKLHFMPLNLDKIAVA